MMPATRTMAVLIAVVTTIVSLTPRVSAQDVYGPPTPGSQRAVLPSEPASATQAFNPLVMLEQAGAAIPGRGAGGPIGDPDQPTGISTAMSIMVLLTVVSLAPSIMLMTTCFMRIIIVLALLRQAIGAASIPPPQVLTALALFMTLLIMTPTLERVWDEAVVPYQAGEITDYDELWQRARQPIRDFMFNQLETTGNWSSLYMVLEYQGVDISDPASLSRSDVSTAALVPAFMLSELKTAFVMGFKVYLPFLVIDMVIASLLISMSMMMLPPVLISLPFKLLLFVLVDGWTLVVGGLLYSFDPGANTTTAMLSDPAILEPLRLALTETARVAMLR